MKGETEAMLAKKRKLKAKGQILCVLRIEVGCN
jgi:hypothetical protein